MYCGWYQPLLHCWYPMPLTMTVVQSVGRLYTIEPIMAEVTATPAPKAAASQNGWSQ